MILDEIQRVPSLLNYIQVIVRDSPWDSIYQGFLPRIYDQNQRPTQAYSHYYQTYVEQDVRQLINLKDLAMYEKLSKLLLAGRAGQLMDYRSLANDVGGSATATAAKSTFCCRVVGSWLPLKSNRA